MTASMDTEIGIIARNDQITLRRIQRSDLPQISRFAFTVSITDALTNLSDLTAAFEATGFRTETAEAIAITEAQGGRLLGTAQIYRSAPCIHGYEMGYIVHDPADRSRGTASDAVRLFADHLFQTRPDFYRLQLIIEAWNVPSWKLAERCGFVREGLLRSAGFGTGDPADCYIYSRTRKDWHESRHSPVSLGGLPA